ncbi:MAG: peroxiredoxin [Paraglaciecola sp.]|jgi:peroxiredoxin
MKNILYTFLAISLFALFSFTNSEVKKEVKITVEMTGCETIDSLFIFEFDGLLFKRVKGTKRNETQKYEFKMPQTGPRFYYVGMGGNNIKPLIIGTEKEITVKGACNAFGKATIENSPINKTYLETKLAMNKFKSELNSMVRTFQQAQRRGAGDQIKKLKADMADLDKRRLAAMEELKKTHPYMAKVAALNTYLSFPNNGKGYDNEILYFAAKYFEFADWKDNDYNYLPWVYEGLKSYTTTLSSVNLLPEKQQEMLDALLVNIPEDTRTYKLAIGGLMAGLQAKGHPNYVVYGKRFIEKYKIADPEAVLQVEKEVAKLAAFSIGGQAPDFTMNDEEGNPKKLSDFRGQVVLVDFWASWCGPCRKENPSVVKMYEKYKEKGFEILSVSLDKDKSRWLGAIEKDNLTWSHVSDLKGWKNEAAQLYGVRSIPETVLLDSEGKIIARKLRGPMLEAKLAEIFGE